MILHNRPYAYDIIISLSHHLGDIGLVCVNAVISDVPAADHKHVQGIGFCPQHGSAMTSMNKVYRGKLSSNALCRYLTCRISFGHTNSAIFRQKEATLENDGSHK